MVGPVKKKYEVLGSVPRRDLTNLNRENICQLFLPCMMVCYVTVCVCLETAEVTVTSDNNRRIVVMVVNLKPCPSPFIIFTEKLCEYAAPCLGGLF